MAVRTFVPEHSRKRIHGVSEMWKCPVCGRGFVRQGQPHFCGRPETVDEYIAAQDEAVRPMLIQLRTVLRLAVPDAQERISWSMPTLWKGRSLIHFAAAKKHVGLYPGGEATAVFAEKLKGFDVSKGTVRLPYDRELPAELITQIAQWCRREYGK